MKQKKNILIGQSGGPTAVINASLAGVLTAALASPDITAAYGLAHGIEGMLKEDFVDLSSVFSGRTDLLKRLSLTPAMYLGSCRYKLPSFEENPDVYERIFSLFEKYSIFYFFYIGGNDSMDTAAKLADYGERSGSPVRVIGIPKTIDNDLAELDHTPGFGSAAKFIASSLLEISHDTYIYPMKSVLIAEIMGRNAGWLTASSVLARTEYSSAPHLIYLPELPFSTSAFIRDIRKQLTLRDQVIVAVSEGVRDTEGEYISAQASRVDQFGHIMLSGTGKYLEGLVSDAVGCKVRSIELNVLQRCAGHCASLTDVREAFALGEQGFAAACLGHTGQMVTLTRTGNSPYAVAYGLVPTSRVANTERKVPPEWISPSHNDVEPAMTAYLRPLIEGEVPLSYKNGVPDYLYLPLAK